MANPTDKRFHQLTLAIQKAINAIETPVKEKHVRSTIIGTFQEQSAVTYWMVAIRQPLQDNRIVAWKFCHVTHKLLREGHPACLDDSQRHTGMIENLGKLWVHLREGYGRLVHLYCALLVSKLKFHQRNPRFPGNMQLTADELDAIAENDVNNYFQLCVELFDYMDDILNLQAAVFESLGNARANSMTASGQCRLAALIPCAQDSSHIYDCNVRLLFRLHAALPADTLVGHRERFRQQFKKLSSFYKHASSLQYYRNLLTLPVLPSNPPNFLLQSDFGTYVAPVVSIPEPPPDEVDSVASLIDTSDTVSQVSQEHIESFDTRTTPSPQPDPIVERDRLIDHLQNELKRMRSEVSQLVQERNTMLGSMREHCTRLESQLQATKSELEEEKQRAEVLSAETPEIKQKLVQTEDKAKVIDEKFQKLKGAYTQLREEHITLIRQKAEVDKLSSSLRAAAAQQESSKMMLQQQLNDRMKDVELLQQSASSSEEIEAYKNEITNLRSELENSRQKEVELETLKASMETLEIEHKTAMTEQKEKDILVTNELKEVSERLERVQKEIEEKEAELTKTKEELSVVKVESGADVKRILEEKEAAVQEVVELKQKYQQEKENINNECENIKMDYDESYRKQSAEILRLEKEVDELVESKNSAEMCADLLESELKDITEIKIKIEKVLEEKEINISSLENEIKEIEYVNKIEIEKLKKLLEEKNKFCQIQTAESEKLSHKVSELEAMLSSKDENITELIKKLNKELGVTDDVFNNFKELLASKDEQILALNTEVTKLSDQLSRLEDELKETNAELEIGNNELIILKEDFENMKVQHEFELSTKNNELQRLEKEISKLSTDKGDIEIEKNKIINELYVEKEVLENNRREIKETINKLNSSINIIRSEKAEMENNLNGKIDELNSIIDDKTTKLEELTEKVNYQFKILCNKEITLDLVMKERDDFREKLDEIKQLKIKEKDEMESVLSDKLKDNQMICARLEHTETERLNAECELQDLLQHNTVLEADVASLKAQLEEAQSEIKRQRSRVLCCAGEAALAVASGALDAHEHGSARDTYRLAAELAVNALNELATQKEVSGNEETLAKSAIHAAHNTAQLSAYIMEVCNVSTDMELSDKLSGECRSMLLATKTCLESVCEGRVEAGRCAAALGGVRRAADSAAHADSAPAPANVDDELATMDTAIEHAAKQIEEMLAASRAGDSGVKLEVNEKILDACTTLMGAVKALVQDARRLQRELGDTSARQNMYRRNPQWSEGLISAAKAVVFAAKLLVSSADETVNGKGRVEGVSAAAHSVAGSTAQLVAASRARAPPAAPALARLTAASRHVAAAAGAVLAAARHAADLARDTEALDTSALTLTATRILEMESKVRALELETALDKERARLAELRKRHYHLAQLEENGNMTNGKE
ncbi:PREDICTED: huntingtin-interacting protein 1 isoform X2 [Papilio polytes]|uniref:huntingtin-interacting protein 1 isoform X2 n=1 Tax=Papilio polytes TaxID=76194 RepID=UPI00067674BD|nr:PREDICTED: huntingtin-interacting protein 1 isoform X2 [Papilio polytes]XP_013145196.1 PREDICTED: huntingtin-interacting protein 1 isoform X2 [Papilio polytes]